LLARALRTLQDSALAAANRVVVVLAADDGEPVDSGRLELLPAGAAQLLDAVLGER
jgi:hypothetical protein